MCRKVYSRRPVLGASSREIEPAAHEMLPRATEFGLIQNRGFRTEVVGVVLRTAQVAIWLLLLVHPSPRSDEQEVTQCGVWQQDSLMFAPCSRID